MARHPMRSLSAHLLIAALVAGLVRPPVATALPAQFLPELVAGASGPSVAVVVVTLDLKARAQAGLLEAEAEAAVTRSGRLALVTGHDAFNPDAAKKRAQALASAREKVAQGQKALDDLDNVKATGAFVDALALYKQADTTQVAREYLDALVLKAASHATGGETGPAKKGIDAALAFDARAEFSPTFFPPDLVKYAEAQRKGALAARGELTVRTEPSGARVWVDGAYLGPSPATASNLGPGKHFVAAAASGSALAQAELPPGDGQVALEPAELSAEYTRATARVSADPEGPGRDQGARELGKALGVDQVLLVIARKSLAGDQLDLIAERLDTRDGHNWSYRALTVRADGAAAFFDGLLLKDTLRSGRDPVTNFKSSGGAGGMRTNVAIGLLGLGAAGLVTGGVFGFMASNQASAFKQTVQTDVVKSTQLRTSGQAYAVVADISFLIGLASAATGTVLLVTNVGNGSPASDDGAAAAAAAKKEEAARRRDAERKASEDRARADEARRKSDADAAAKRDDERRKADEAAAAKRADDEKKKADDDKKKPDDDESPSKKKLTKKQQQEEERKRREDEARAAAEEKKRQADEAKARKEEEARAAAEEKKRQADEAKAKKDAAAKKADEKKPDEKKVDEAKPDEKKSGDDDAAARRAAEEKRKKEDDERRRLEDEKRTKEEDERKKKNEDHDDLRNF